MGLRSWHRPGWALALLAAALLAAQLVGGATGGGPAVATAQAGTYDVLVFSRTTGFRHTAAINAGRSAIQELGDDAGFNVTLSEDPALFSHAGLREFEAIVFLNTDGEGILTGEERTALERWMQRGGGVVGIHADANADRQWDWKTDMMGGATFENHPEIQEATVEVEDGGHPATAHLGDSFTWTDEWYNFAANPRGDVHVLLTVDESTYDGGEHGDDHPIAWCSEYDGGRHFYTALGHADGGATPAWSNSDYRQHILGAIEWAAGESAGDCGPARAGLPTAASLEKVTLDDDPANPMSIDIAEDGRVFYVEMGSTQSTSGPARVKMIEPDGDVHVIATLQVHRRNENGLLGIALDPGFAENNFVYLYYSQPGPVTQMGMQKLSRFTFDPSAGSAGALDMSSEVVLLEVPHQRLVCCHSAGSIQFGPDGYLYIATGDDTEHARSGGYSPHDSRKCGPGSWTPGDATCDANAQTTWPEDALHANDARRSSGNTNDLRGKIIRIDPIESAEPSDPPGPGSTYEIPEGNLFEPGTPDTRPEIYSMGHRNPFRFGFDPKTGWLYLGEVGPDANSDSLLPPPSNGRGPRGYDEVNQIRSAGNYGWPFCIADNQAYRPWNFTGVGTNGGNGSPDPDVNAPYFDCEGGPINTSPRNTGLAQLPPAREAWIWYPYGASPPQFADIPQGQARTAMGGDVYRYDPELDSEVKLPEWFDGKLIWGDWSRNLMLATKVGDDGSYQGTTQILPDELFRHPHDIEIGPDGALYLIEWGLDFNYGSYNVNPDSGIYRLQPRTDFSPVATIQADRTTGPAPLEVRFTGERSDRGGDGAPTYEWDFGDGSAGSTEPNPTHSFSAPGTYEVTLTVSEGEVTDSTAVEIQVQGAGCVPARSDEFDGDELDSRWEVVRREDDRLSVADGSLNLVSAPLDIHGGDTGMPNIVLQPIPGGGTEPWSMTARMTWNPTQNYQNAGLMIYADDANFIKFAQVWNGSRQFEVWKELNNSPGEEAFSGDIGGGFPTTYWVRFVSANGTDVQAQYAPDVAGEPGSWITLATRNLSGLPSPLRVGVYATASTAAGAGQPTASFHSVRFEPDEFVCLDKEAPVTTASLEPAEPGAGGEYEGPVEVTLSATDGEDEDATGVERISYRIDGGAWVDVLNTEGEDPFETSFVVEDPGDHEVEYRAADHAGNQEDVRSVEFTIDAPAVAASDVYAVDTPSPALRWVPDEITVDWGTRVTWHFDPPGHVNGNRGALVAHDVWVVPPGGDQRTPAQGGDAIEVSEGTVDVGGDPVSFTPREEGRWVFFCQIHSTIPAGESERVGMVGTMDVGAPTGSPNLRLAVKPKAKRAKAGRALNLRATVRNRGEVSAANVRICAKAPKRFVKIAKRKRCATAKSLAAGARVAQTFKVKPTKRARGKRVRVTITATAKGTKTLRAKAALRVKRR